MDPQNPIFAYEFFTNHNFEKLVIGKEVGYLNFVGEKALNEEAKAKLNKSLNNYIQEIVKEKKL